MLKATLFRINITCPARHLTYSLDRRKIDIYKCSFSIALSKSTIKGSGVRTPRSRAIIRVVLLTFATVSHRLFLARPA